MTETALETYTKTRTEIKAKIEAAREIARQAFSEGCKEIFQNNPNLISFQWTQYTPYFNDGDACYFGVRYPDDISDYELADFSGYEYPSGGWRSPEYETYKEKIEALTNPVIDFMQQFSKDDLEWLFNDHSRIMVHRDEGITVQEYTDHD